MIDPPEQLQRDNQALTLALQAQREINHYKQFFLARVAHELRSPLSSLMSLQQLILHDLCENPAEAKEFLKDAHLAAQKLLKMIDDLVTVAKIDYGKIHLDCEPIALTDLLQELEYTVKLPVGNHNWKLDLHAPDSLPPINGDRQKILWVLRNLIDRALTTCPEHSGVITLAGSFDREATQVLIHLQLPGSPAIWQFSATDGETQNPPALGDVPTISLSPPLTWQLAQTLMANMGASLAPAIENPRRESIGAKGLAETPQTLFVLRFAVGDPEGNIPLEGQPPYA